MKRISKGRIRKIISLVLVLMMVIPFSLFELGTTGSTATNSGVNGWTQVYCLFSSFLSAANVFPIWDDASFWQTDVNETKVEGMCTYPTIAGASYLESTTKQAINGFKIRMDVSETAFGNCWENNGFCDGLYCGFTTNQVTTLNHASNACMSQKPIANGIGIYMYYQGGQIIWYLYKNNVVQGEIHSLGSYNPQTINLNNYGAGILEWEFRPVSIDKSTGIGTYKVYVNGYAQAETFTWDSRDTAYAIGGIHCSWNNSDLTSNANLNSRPNESKRHYSIVSVNGIPAKNAISAHTHQYANTKPATCNEAGYQTCSTCGAINPIAKTSNHQYGSWVYDSSTQKHSRTCSICNKAETNNCSWDSGTVTVQPTCIATGVKAHTCTVCGGTKNEVMAAWGHNITTDTTWTNNTTYEAQICTRCNTEINRRIKVTYDANTGSGAPETTYSNSKTVTSGTMSYSGTLSATVPTLSGYSFQGWSKTQHPVGFGTAEYQNGSSFSGFTESTTLYAVWKIENKIVFHFNGGTFQTEPDGIRAYGNSFTIHANGEHGTYTITYYPDRVEYTNFTPNSTVIALPLANYSESSEYVIRNGYTSIAFWADSLEKAQTGHSSDINSVSPLLVTKTFPAGRTDLYAAWATVLQINPNGGTVANAGPGGCSYVAIYEKDSSGNVYSDTNKYTLGDYHTIYTINDPENVDQMTGYFSEAMGGTQFTKINPRKNTSNVSIAPRENILLYTQWHYMGTPIILSAGNYGNGCKVNQIILQGQTLYLAGADNAIFNASGNGNATIANRADTLNEIAAAYQNSNNLPLGPSVDYYVSWDYPVTNIHYWKDTTWFVGWNTKADGTGTWLSSIDENILPTLNTDILTGNKIVYAVWGYPIVWNANGGHFIDSFSNASNVDKITTWVYPKNFGSVAPNNYSESFTHSGYVSYPETGDIIRDGYTLWNGFPNDLGTFQLLYGAAGDVYYDTYYSGRWYAVESGAKNYTSAGVISNLTYHQYPTYNGMFELFALWLPNITLHYDRTDTQSAVVLNPELDLSENGSGHAEPLSVVKGRTNKAFDITSITENGCQYWNHNSYNPIYKPLTIFNPFTVPNGYRLKGWNTDPTEAANGIVGSITADGTTKQLTPEFVFSGGYAADTGIAPMNLYAVWERDSLTVTFKSEDGTDVLEIATVNFGASASFGGPIPTKAPTAQYTYTFAGWKTDINGAGVTPNINNVTENITVYAYFTATPVPYTITWLNYDGTTIATTQAAYGTVPVYDGTTPTKPNDNFCTYTFNGWNPILSAVTGDATYTAQFTEVPKEFTITYNFNNTDYAVTEGYYIGKTVSFDADWISQSSIEETYTYGNAVILPQSVNINCNKCKFLGWYDNPDCTGNPIEAITTTDYGNKIFYAKWIPYTLFVFGDEFRLNIDNEKIGDFTKKKYEPVNVNQQINLEYTGNKDFCYWINGTNKLLGTNKSLSMTFYSVSKITAVTHSRDDNQSIYKYVAFMSDENQVFKSVYTSEIDNSIANDLPGGIFTSAATAKDIPTKLGWIFKGWSLTRNAEESDTQIVSAINSAILNSTGIIMVFPVYEKNTSVYTVEIHDNTQTITKEIAIGEAYGFECATPGFSYWMSANGDIVSFNPHYVVRKFNSITYTYTVVYNDSEEQPRTILSQPECYITWATSPKKRFSFTTSIAVPKGDSLVEMGILYTTKNAVGINDFNFQLDKSGVSKYKSESPSNNQSGDTFFDTGTITLSLVTGNTSGTIYARGYAITKASDGTLIYTYSATNSIATSATPAG